MELSPWPAATRHNDWKLQTRTLYRPILSRTSQRLEISRLNWKYDILSLLITANIFGGLNSGKQSELACCRSFRTDRNVLAERACTLSGSIGFGCVRSASSNGLHSHWPAADAVDSSPGLAWWWSRLPEAQLMTAAALLRQRLPTATNRGFFYVPGVASLLAASVSQRQV